MPRFLSEIRSDEIVRWAEGNPTALFDLPKLVRKLILASISVKTLDFRADGGVNISGPDGLVETDSKSCCYCPCGRSLWELSVKDDVKAKLNSDYGKRTADVAPEIRSL